MKCPYCGYKESKVVDSRPADEGNSIRRRRECLACEKRFTTYEMAAARASTGTRCWAVCSGPARSGRCPWRTWSG